MSWDSTCPSFCPLPTAPQDYWENEKRQCVQSALFQWLPQVTGSLTKAVLPLTLLHKMGRSCYRCVPYTPPC